MNVDTARQYFRYNRNTGIIYWRKSPHPNTPTGTKAGGLDSKGYIRICFKYKSYLAHRLAWLIVCGHWPKDCIDHTNRVRSDNRWCNLREANNSLNQKNQSLPKNNTTGLRGVYRDIYLNKWRAQIGHNSESIFLGHYADFFDAVCARKSAENKYGYIPETKTPTSEPMGAAIVSDHYTLHN